MSDNAYRYRAVQEDADAFVMDWPVFDDRGTTHTAHRCLVVLDPGGDQVAYADRVAPEERDPDDVLEHLGWTRAGDWEQDDFGRMTAPVVGVDPEPARPLPQQRSAASDPALLYW